MCLLKSVLYSDCKHKDLIHEARCKPPHRKCEYIIKSFDDGQGLCTACKVVEGEMQARLRELEGLHQVKKLVQEIKKQYNDLQDEWKEGSEESEGDGEYRDEENSEETSSDIIKTENFQTASEIPIDQTKEELAVMDLPLKSEPTNGKRKLEEVENDNGDNEEENLTFQKRIRVIFNQSWEEVSTIHNRYWSFLGRSDALNLATGVGTGNKRAVNLALASLSQTEESCHDEIEVVWDGLRKKLTKECETIVKEQAKTMAESIESQLNGISKTLIENASALVSGIEEIEEGDDDSLFT